MSDLQTPDVTATSRRVELVLQELDSLPTLSAVAVRLLELTSDAAAESREVIELVSSDLSLSARVLKMCRCHARGRAADVTTIDRAVLLLGFDAIRSAVLGVQVFDALDGLESPGGEKTPTQPSFDREAFWLHSLAVAIVTQSLVEVGSSTQDLNASEAFIAGLLHDVGQLALHVLLPQSFDRVCQITETHAASLDRACRQIIGLDTHTVGKRLAEHWGLPAALVDVIWLNGQSFEALPAGSHRMLVAAVTLADALVRTHYLSAGAQWSRGENLTDLAIPIGINVDQLDGLISDLHEKVAQRADALGIELGRDHHVLLRTLIRANRSLARANSGMRQREQSASLHAGVLKAVTDFQRVVRTGAPMVDTLAAIARSAASALNTTPMASIFRNPEGGGWSLVRFSPSGAPYGLRSVSAPEGSIALETILRDIPASVPAATVVPWLARTLDDPAGFDGWRTLPLPTGGGGSLLIVDRESPELSQRDAFEGLYLCWQSALTAAGQHDAGAHVAEQLAESNRALHEMQETLARARTMSTLGEVAAGAAHEMNNPLTVISGRAQLLANRVTEAELHKSAVEIASQAQQLSDMITALRSFAEPVVLNRRRADVAEIVVRAVQQFGPGERRQPVVNTVLASSLVPANVDPDLLTSAVGQLVRNACESRGVRQIEVRVQIEPLDGRLKIEVRDDGSGLSEHALRHAFDPFFSEKPAGRQPGLGLPHAQRWVEAHGGRVTLVNSAGGGAVATIWLSDWRLPEPTPARTAPARGRRTERDPAHGKA